MQQNVSVQNTSVYRSNVKLVTTFRVEKKDYKNFVSLKSCKINILWQNTTNSQKTFLHKTQSHNFYLSQGLRYVQKDRFNLLLMSRQSNRALKILNFGFQSLNEACNRSYKRFTFIIYNSRVVHLANLIKDEWSKLI